MFVSTLEADLDSTDLMSELLVAGVVLDGVVPDGVVLDGLLLSGCAVGVLVLWLVDVGVGFVVVLVWALLTKLKGINPVLLVELEFLAAFP